MSILFWLVFISCLAGIIIYWFCIKYPRFLAMLKVLFTPIPKNTFSYWKYHEYRHQKLESKGKFSDKLFAKKYVESNYSDEMNINCAKLLFEGVPTVNDLKGLKHMYKAFVIKANHGCGYNIIVKKDNDLKQEDMIEYINKCSSWLRQTWGNSILHKLLRIQEWQYQYIQPKVFIEECLEEDMTDYKLHTINGTVEFVTVVFDRQDHQFSFNLYGVRPWRLLEGVSKMPTLAYNDPVSKIMEPPQLQTMIEFAQSFTKATKFEYCRVDLYVRHNQVYFGEFTFSPLANMGLYYPLSFEQYLLQKVLGK
eukprot:222053_1